MNEKIRELAGQVCDTLHDGDWNIPNEFIEKFAKSIVYDFLNELTNDDSLGEARIATIERLANRYGVRQ